MAETGAARSAVDAGSMECLRTRALQRNRQLMCIVPSGFGIGGLHLKLTDKACPRLQTRAKWAGVQTQSLCDMDPRQPPPLQVGQEQGAARLVPHARKGRRRRAREHVWRGRIQVCRRQAAAGARTHLLACARGRACAVLAHAPVRANGREREPPGGATQLIAGGSQSEAHSSVAGSCRCHKQQIRIWLRREGKQLLASERLPDPNCSAGCQTLRERL